MPITNLPQANDAPLMLAKVEKSTLRKPFFPTLADNQSILVWVGLVLFFSFYDVFSQFQYLPHWTQAFALFFKTFISNFCIIFGIVGYLHYSIASFQGLPLKGQLRHILLVNLLMTPLMTLLAKLIIFIVLQDLSIFQTLVIDIIINTFLAILVTTLLVYYFTNQYRNISSTQHRYQQKLLEQNAQLKARITPHFFFNMLNTLQSLVESEPKLASKTISSVSKLYRLSFNEPREIALTDEIGLCEEYLTIEKYRFTERLQVTWELPDEDLLYDMVITSLTLQMLIEKMIVMVVEITSQPIHISIAIGWENGLVDITLTTNLPSLADGMTWEEESAHLNDTLSFQAQQDNLQRHFGDTASIGYHIASPKANTQALVIEVQYPLADVG